MSKSCEAWVWDKSDTTGNDRLVLLAIADEANDDGTNAYPSIERIASKARVNRATVLRSIKRLEEREELAVFRPEAYGRGRFNRYVVLMGRPAGMVSECDLSVRGKGRALRDVSGKPKKVAERREKVAQRRAQVRPDLLTSRPLDQTTNPPTPREGEEDLVAALCSALGTTPGAVPLGEMARFSEAASELARINAEPADIRARADRYRSRWPARPLTARALVNNWSALVPPPAVNIDF